MSVFKEFMTLSCNIINRVKTDLVLLLMFMLKCSQRILNSHSAAEKILLK